MNLPGKTWLGKVVAGPNGCHIFTGSLNEQGYGRVRKGGKLYKAHRVIYEECWGPIPEGKLICHRCNVKRCVNPLHIYAGTPHDNMRDRKHEGGYVFSEKHRANLRAARAGRKISEETRRKLSAASLGRKHTEHSRKKISAAKIGKKHSDEHRAKNSAAKVGTKHTPEQTAKIAAANRGRKRTEEQLATLRAAWVLRKQRNYSCKE